ncbi:MAG: serine hydrolase [Vicinamibacterales bacterium]
MSRGRVRAVFLAVLVVPLVLTAQQPSSTAFDGFDGFVTGVMREWKGPGLAVAAVRDGTVVLSKGYGYRDVDKQLPVTPQTLMAIGSNTKSFTVTLMGMLSDEGRLDWDKPVRTYLPDFELHDEVAGRLMTATDLVTHRSGLPRHDAMWFGRAFTRKDMYQRLKYLEPSATFRQRYQYNNLMFMTAGILVEQSTSKSWDELIDQRIFEPLGMTRSNTSVRDLPASGDYALPYMVRDGKVVAVPYRNIDAVGPAGAINSSVEEMTHYIRMHLDEDVYNGKTLVSKRFAIRMQSPHSAPAVNLDPDAPRYAEIVPSGYGLGVAIASYRGHKLVEHGGGIDGFVSAMSWMPDDRIGVVVLTNFGGVNPLPMIVMRNVYDRLLGLDQIDWVGRQKAALAAAEKRQKEREREREAERVAGTSPSHALPDYAGTFEHPGYGVVRVAHENGGLVLALDEFVVPLEHFHYDVFRRVKGDAAPAASAIRQVLDSARVTFSYGANGKVESVSIPLEPAAPEIVFKRKPAPSNSKSTPNQ